MNIIETSVHAPLEDLMDLKKRSEFVINLLKQVGPEDMYKFAVMMTAPVITPDLDTIIDPKKMFDYYAVASLGGNGHNYFYSFYKGVGSLLLQASVRDHGMHAYGWIDVFPGPGAEARSQYVETVVAKSWPKGPGSYPLTVVGGNFFRSPSDAN